MTARLTQRIAGVEAAAYRQRAQRYAERIGCDVDTLLSGARMLDAERRRLEALRLSGREVRRRMIATAADLAGVTVEALEAEYARGLRCA